MDPIKPQNLERGDAIGIISPSSSLNLKQLERIKINSELLKSLGYRVKFGKHFRDRHGHNAGTNENKLSDLHGMFEDNEVRAILASRGGYNSNELLDGIDYSLIRRNPKIFSGYSDITFMHCALHTMTGLVTFYGPNASSLLQLPGKAGDYTYRNFVGMVSKGGAPLRLKPSDAFTFGRDSSSVKRQMRTHWKVLKKGRARGTLFGGHIFTVLNLAGTRYLPDFRGKILFLEDTESTTAMTERFLWQLRMLGAFDAIEGMLFGRANMDEYKTVSPDYGLHKVIRDATAGYDFPIIADVDFGHTLPMLTLPYGIRAEMDAGAEPGLSLLEEAVRG